MSVNAVSFTDHHNLTSYIESRQEFAQPLLVVLVFQNFVSTR